MKPVFKKNQLIIAALGLMIVVAGYLNFTSKDAALTSGEVANQDLDEYANEMTTDDNDSSLYGAIGNQDDAEVSAPVQDSIEDPSQIGEAVLTSGEVAGLNKEVAAANQNMAELASGAKLNREQVRSKEKEALLAIIDNENLSEEQKNSAIEKMLLMTERMEKEAACEQQLAAKGFTSIVSISDDCVDVTVATLELTDIQKAQIEDIVTRKAGVAVSDIVISSTNCEN